MSKAHPLRCKRLKGKAAKAAYLKVFGETFEQYKGRRMVRQRIARVASQIWWGRSQRRRV